MDNEEMERKIEIVKKKIAKHLEGKTEEDMFKCGCDICMMRLGNVFEQ